MTRTIYRHHPGYHDAVRCVLAQPLADDLRLLDDLFGRGGVEDQRDAEAVKAEALRQLEIEWRSGVDAAATLVVAAVQAEVRQDR